MNHIFNQPISKILAQERNNKENSENTYIESNDIKNAIVSDIKKILFLTQEVEKDTNKPAAQSAVETEKSASKKHVNKILAQSSVSIGKT